MVIKLLRLLFTRPSLAIQFDSTDLGIWDVGAPYLTIPKKRKVATARVLNKGEKSIDDCEAFLEIVESGQKIKKQLPLHWADTPYNALSSSMERVNISPLKEHRLDIAFTEESLVKGCSIASAQALANGMARDQFLLLPGSYSVRVTVVSRSGEIARKVFTLHAPLEWRQLNMQIDEKQAKRSFTQRIFEKWHSLNMSAPVKVAVISLISAVVVAVIAGIFMLINTYFQHSLERPPAEKSTSPSFSNTGSVEHLQQQNASTINNFMLREPEVAKPSVDNLEKQQGLKNGGFEQGLSNWEPNEIQAASPDTITVATAHRDVFSIDPYGRTGQCLLIINEQPTTPNKPLWRRQRVYGLKPNSKYELSFYARGFANSPQSLWIVIGDNWFAEGKYYKIHAQKTELTDWIRQSEVITTGDWNEAYIWLITDDIARLRVDDITISEITK